MAMSIQPQSQLKLISNTKLSNDYENTLDFAHAGEQQAYFIGKLFKSYENYRYIRKNQAIIVADNYENLYNCDYVMYKNENFGTRWVYAFINRKEYINDNSTMLYIETDCFQTWLFDIQYFPTYISRAHQREFIGTNPLFDNLYPEQLEYGRDYEVTHTQTITWSKFYAVLCASVDLRGDFGTSNNPNLPSSLGGIYDKMPSALDYYVIDKMDDGEGRTSTVLELFTMLTEYPWIAQCVQSITIVPKECIGDNWGTIESHGITIGRLDSGYVSSNFKLQEINNYLSYFPVYKNSKLYTYPYSFIEMTCYNGSQFIIKPEAIGNQTLNVSLINYIGAQPRLQYLINDYNSNGDNGTTLPDNQDYYGEFLNAGVVNGNFPQLPVMIDNYLLYMANNANSFQLTNSIARYNQIEGAIKGAGQALTGNVVGGIGTAYGAIKQGEITVRQQSAKIQDAELNPPTLGGQSGGDAFNIANGINGVTLKWKTIRPQYKERLEEYFERYGYVQNKIEMPQLYGMSTFNYLQTSNIIIGGNIPDEDRNVIKRMFDSGVTIWHNGDIGNYSSNTWTGQ